MKQNNSNDYVSIYDPTLDIFRVDESYDVRQVIVNKKEKYDVSSANPNDFLTFFFKIKKLSPLIFYDKVVVFWFGISILIGFVIILGCCAHPYQLYLESLALIWVFFALTVFFFVLYLVLYFLPFATFHSYNKKYLQSLKKLFKKMQDEGYIEKDLSKYPESLQMAFWEYHWYDWHRDLNHIICHWSWYDGFLALKYFFWVYDNLNFPIDENAKWICWFDHCVGCYYMADRTIHYTFHPDSLT